MTGHGVPSWDDDAARGPCPVDIVGASDWSRTVGWRPEVIVIGLVTSAAEGRLRWVVARALDGRPLQPGVVDRFGRLRVLLRPVDATAVQLLWADWRNVLPGEPGCDPSVRERQRWRPELGRDLSRRSA